MHEWPYLLGAWFFNWNGACTSFRQQVNYLLWQAFEHDQFLYNFSHFCSTVHSFVSFSFTYLFICPFMCSGFELDFTYILWVVWASRSFETITCESFWEGLICFFICFMVPLTHGNYKPLLVSSGKVVELCNPWTPLSFKNLCLCTRLLFPWSVLLVLIDRHISMRVLWFNPWWRKILMSNF